jgi:hypothetical protein
MDPRTVNEYGTGFRRSPLTIALIVLVMTLCATPGSAEETPSESWETPCPDRALLHHCPDIDPALIAPVSVSLSSASKNHTPTAIRWPYRFAHPPDAIPLAISHPSLTRRPPQGKDAPHARPCQRRLTCRTT